MKFKISFILCISIFQMTIPIIAQINSRLSANKEGIVFKTILSQRISESSGLIHAEGKLWTQDDSGGPAAIFSIDTLTGEIKQTVYIDNYPNVNLQHNVD